MNEVFDDQIAELQEAADIAWDAYANSTGFSGNEHAEYTDAFYALSQKQLEKSQANPGCGYPCN